MARHDHGEGVSWGPQSARIPVGGGLGILAAVALLTGVAFAVPEVGFWALFATPASAVIGLIYVLVQRRIAKPPIDLHLNL